MSMDFIGLFDITNPAVNPDWLLKKLAASPAEINAIVDLYRHRWRRSRWEIEISHVTGQPILYGPGGFAIRFNESRILELYHVIPFWFFASNSECRAIMRPGLFYIANLVGSQRMVCFHELMPWDGKTLRDAEAVLRAKVGPAAESFEQLAVADDFSAYRWYIDTFVDLRTIDDGAGS